MTGHFSGKESAFASCEMDGLNERVTMTKPRTYLFGGMITVLTVILVTANIRASHPRFSWGIANPGGSALTTNNSRIDITGTGTFEVKPGNPHVTGGGTWTTSAPDGTVTGNGTYAVTGLVKFDLAPGTALAGPSFHAGLAFLNIEYSDGEEGILVVSCRVRFGTPETVSEGISVSKGFTDYWNGFTTGTFTFFQALDEL
jgi:hypothetical protein